MVNNFFLFLFTLLVSFDVQADDPINTYAYSLWNNNDINQELVEGEEDSDSDNESIVLEQLFDDEERDQGRNFYQLNIINNTSFKLGISSSADEEVFISQGNFTRIFEDFICIVRVLTPYGDQLCTRVLSLDARDENILITSIVNSDDDSNRSYFVFDFWQGEKRDFWHIAL